MTHVRPDGDALGCELALANALQRLGKETRVVIASVMPPRYNFLDPERKTILRFNPADPTNGNYDAIVIVDTGAWTQLGDFGDWMKTAKADKAVIDHHVTQDDLGAVLFQDISAEACGRLIHEAMLALKVPHTKASAEYLFMALAMDTGWFHHERTLQRTFELAGELTKSGANPKELYEILYEQNSPARLKLMGRVLERLVIRDKIAYSHVLRTDYEELGAVPGDTEDMIDLPRSLAGVEVSLMFMEQPAGGIKISFRSRGKYDVSKVAVKFHGGGHALACGGSSQDPLDVTIPKVVAAVQEIL
ncbi:bifunctional oligoribonuclease/PAP phosphatase NrnA [Telmatocola sphagniphila]|uniref:Bifunctional oligoribonuclease/PAP phosphatase NrnA n=1 Tax=Telmatocola sphagniphila TaxID=1123043 RepID=A0A8E6EWD8_9BACT|nr:bifunctional oligoribonuclease/PAP phosphatase NrnA [Telmatocola sphagniphila]QVL30026.1 bifunctional oligoribonuclease/PAP phosphatase NrnA [Telmatocola sphagniphila]